MTPQGRVLREARGCIGRLGLFRPALLVAGMVAVVFIVLEALLVVRLPGFHAPSDAFSDDFQFYWRAGRRLLVDPRSLYLATSKVDLRGFLYPPPSIVLFLPLASLPQGIAVWIFRAIDVAALFASVALLVRLFEADGVVVHWRDSVLLGMVALATGPTFAEVLFAQVNGLVLLDCIFFRWLLYRRRPLVAGAVLAIGVLLKVYPLLCLLWVVVWERQFYDVRRVLAGFVTAIVAIPILCLPIVPLSLYGTYVSEIVPAVQNKTFTWTLNQSLLGAFARWGDPIDHFLHLNQATCWLPVEPARWARRANAAIAATCVLGLGHWARSAHPLRRPASFLCLLLIIPVTSPLGWAYVYVMALPALLFALASCPPRSIVKSVLLVGLCVLYFIPAWHPFRFTARLPELLQHALYARYAAAAIILGVLILRSVPAGQTVAPATH